MLFHRKLEDPELFDLLAIHTNRLTQIMVYGETYMGEYDACRRTIEMIQYEVHARRGFHMNSTSYNGSFKQQDSAA